MTAASVGTSALKQHVINSRTCSVHAARSSAARVTASRRRCVHAKVAVDPHQATASTEVALGEGLREQFPILHQEVAGRPLVYLDNAATSQKPKAVLNALSTYYSEYNSNVHRGVHHLAARATTAYEEAREKVARFVNAGSSREIVFTRNATEAINLVAHAWGDTHLRAGDEIVLSVAEHHSNLVPWQLLAQRTGAVLKFAELSADQALTADSYRSAITPRTRLVSFVHVSNVLAGVAPVHDIVDMAHKVGARVLLDACQSLPHMPVDARALGVDWLVASGHKMCGPTGIGFLWGKPDALGEMGPWMGGGEMIQDVFLDHSTYAEPPMRFEAGTPAIAEAIGLGAACDFLSGLGMQRVHDFEHRIGDYLYDRLSSVDGVRIYGPSPERSRALGGRASLSAFNVEGLHATDVSTILDQAGVAVRSGHHCTQPLHRALGIAASARASLYIYNTEAEVDAFVEALRDTVKFFRDV